MRAQVSLFVVMVLATQAARATSACREPSGDLREVSPNGNGNEPHLIPTNAHFFVPLGDDEHPPRGVFRGQVPLEVETIDRGTHLELVPVEPLVPGEVLSYDANTTLFTVADDGDEDVPSPPHANPHPRFDCTPISIVDISHKYRYALLLARFDDAPGEDDADAVVVPNNDTLVLEGDAGTERSVFLVGLDVAGNRSEPAEVSVSFPLSIACSHTNAARAPVAWWAALPLLFLIRRRSLRSAG
jgi:hypothetical protein